jgi:hypothetical protein
VPSRGCHNRLASHPGCDVGDRKLNEHACRCSRCTKHHARKLAKQLNDSGIPSVDLHGNLSQPARDRNLAAFNAGEASVLVATDIAARGVHVDDVELVVHIDPPSEHKAYLHRSGRTARAGNAGDVVTVVLPEQRRDTQALLRKAGIRFTAPPMARQPDIPSPVFRAQRACHRDHRGHPAPMPAPPMIDPLGGRRHAPRPDSATTPTSSGWPRAMLSDVSRPHLMGKPGEKNHTSPARLVDAYTDTESCCCVVALSSAIG